MRIRQKLIVPKVGEQDVDELYVCQQDAVQAEKLQLTTIVTLKHNAYGKGKMKTGWRK